MRIHLLPLQILLKAFTFPTALHCNSYCITTSNLLSNIFRTFYPYSFWFQDLTFTIVHMTQVILLWQFKSFWRVPNECGSLLLSCFLALLHLLCPGDLLPKFIQLSSQSFWFPWERPMIHHSLSLHSSTNLFLSPEWSTQGSEYSLSREAHVLSASCHQYGINGTRISRPTTEFKEEPVVLPQYWQTDKKLGNLDCMLLPNIISVFASISDLTIEETIKFLRDRYENFGLLLFGIFLIF